ncbi:hypothetical protein [Leucobacter luti]|uniref:hypothetical protein n=1 Tax=Leucobacter luti TaxID=340320 RepID=UPI003D010F10
MKTARRIGAIVAALGLAATLASCAGGQSVADACKIANDTMTDVANKAQSDVQTGMQDAMAGKDVNFGEIFKPVVKALEDTQGKVTNEEVKKPLDKFVTEYKSFASTIEEVDLSALKDAQNIDPTAPDAQAKLEELQKSTEKLQADITESSTKLQESSTELNSVCSS